ncbi:PadR family transcriptional regulator [Kribbella sp. NPDC059898]|uniref:PadR family transcriptional regulator n=1 Tax=Kribbella sp. NPDC059898 TaxID=3346995 RepID=UPI00364F04D2
MARDNPKQEGGDLPSLNALAVLGLLATAPMTAYALAEQTQRSLRWVWTASRRGLLGEPKRLAERGLVEAVPVEAGSRAGQRWRAAEAGRRTIRRWLATPVTPTGTNSEIALRLIFADQSDLPTLKARVAERLEQIQQEMQAGLTMLDSLLANGGPFPDRLHITTATSELIIEQRLAEHTALTWLANELTHWPDTKTPQPQRNQATLTALHKRLTTALNSPA